MQSNRMDIKEWGRLFAKGTSDGIAHRGVRAQCMCWMRQAQTKMSSSKKQECHMRQGQEASGELTRPEEKKNGGCKKGAKKRRGINEGERKGNNYWGIENTASNAKTVWGPPPLVTRLGEKKKERH